MWVIAALAIAGAVLLVLSGLSHVRRWKPLFSSLQRHDLLPYAVGRWTARLLPWHALTVGGTTLVALLVPAPPFVTSIALALAALTYGAMAAYLVLVLRRDASATCNCFGVSQPLGPVSVLRALACSAASSVLLADRGAREAAQSPAAFALAASLVVVLAISPSITVKRTDRTYA